MTPSTPPDRVRHSADRRAVPRTDTDRRRHHDAIYVLARAAEMQDEDTGSHVLRIRLLVQRIAHAMNVPDAEALGYDAMLHDVGKLSIPHPILKKPAPLTDAERLIMESHTILGAQLLSGRRSMQRAARIARWHHEAWDGSGYPDGLRANDIPVEARITAAADVLDALVSDRCYKEAWTYRAAIDQIMQFAGTRLDPDVVAALERADEDGALKRVFAAGREEPSD